MRRASILKNRPLADDQWSDLRNDLPILHGLSPADLQELRRITTVFLHEKVYEGENGIDVTPRMRAVIAVQAGLPVLKLGLNWYADWHTVVIVPDTFIRRVREQDAAGVVHEWEEDQSGESWDDGPVLLSWEDVEASGWGNGSNVVIHEAAHRLDLTDGEMNGRPFLHRDMDTREWHDVFSSAFGNLKGRPRRKRKQPRIDTYAAKDDAEFFAVASEYFFEQPGVLGSEYPDVYRLLARFYKQDPLTRSTTT